MRRILIVGSCGAGKTYLSRKLDDKLCLPIIHLDSYYWNQNWQELPVNEKIKLAHELSRGKEWIMDGNYASTLNIRMQFADTIIFLDLNRWLCLFRVFKRFCIYFVKERFELNGKNCNERINLQLINYILNYPKIHKDKILKQISSNSHIKRYIFSSRKQIKQFLQSI